MPAHDYIRMKIEDEEEILSEKEVIEEKALDPISSRNNPLYKLQSEKTPVLQRSEYQS
jgi:hypothetical protein